MEVNTSDNAITTAAAAATSTTTTTPTPPPPKTTDNLYATDNNDAAAHARDEIELRDEHGDGPCGERRANDDLLVQILGGARLGEDQVDHDDSHGGVERREGDQGSLQGPCAVEDEGLGGEVGDGPDEARYRG